MLTLDTKITKLAGIGPKMAGRLKKLGIENVLDFLYHFPLRYDDFSKITPIVRLKAGQSFCVRVKILEIKTQRSPRKRMFLTTALVSDETGSVKAVWYNQPFLTRILKRGQKIILAGKTEWGHYGFFLQNPAYEREGKIVPIYPETEGITSKWLRKIISSLLSQADKISDFLPLKTRENQGLVELKDAIKQIHSPASFKDIKEARKRLGFEEHFLIQLKMLKMKQGRQKESAPKIEFNLAATKSLVKKLPFKLTNAQRKAAWEILQDIQKSSPMSRLLEGDVGSGKTVVAAIAMLSAAKNKYQSVLLAPTEILAIQHFVSLSKLLKDFDVSVALLTGGKSSLKTKKKELRIKKKDLTANIRKGEVDIIIGTHALIQEKINFKKLALAIIDEQHRFGVEQRAALRRRLVPHLLSMSATPIPRTLSLSLYGDLDLSILDEMPPGRQKVSTHLVPPEKREDAYKFIKKEIKNGRQVFVICPLIEESDKLGVKAATEEYKKLKQEVFPDLKIALLHGKLKTKEKEKVMAEFKSKKHDILVSTAVVEVGVDVPNASVMLIEGADRFGLAQLHQFRGRVGRAEHKSYCFLFTESGSQKTLNRLRAMVNLNDGFKLAEKDLEIRGPGELYGVRQHGFWDLKMASLTDFETASRARKEAEGVIKSGLENYPMLQNKFKEVEKKAINS